MKCPRCSHTGIITDAESFDGNELVWSILRCDMCCFSWRSSEESIPQIFALRPNAFKIAPEQIGSLPIVLPCPHYHKRS
ncbi:non-oxidative hydroxyarylic acid decarboxylases subunit D [Paraburkholderia sp. CNPSo 3076]|uniref:non-oxidative hydroxyarylic acid decarboxylases subunit D n=1 Tax=Paraburkholderia sp. CNPSo 3076 TaxID=2940936 RepID=UPI003A5236D1